MRVLSFTVKTSAISIVSVLLARSDMTGQSGHSWCEMSVVAFAPMQLGGPPSLVASSDSDSVYCCK